MKIIVWVVFPIIYIKKNSPFENIKKFIGLQNAKRGILYGLYVSIAWITLSYFFQGPPKLNLVFSLTLLWVIAGTPISEEFSFRGIILPGLQKAGMAFWPANIITSVIFICIHCLGWAFQGVLATSLFSVTSCSILLFSLVAGWLRYKSDSLYGSVILHSLNNLFSALK
ncbi:CPBP family intramembrane metalloprotease [Candidatus Dojkabacteria bacterium]|nr:CPBP family intramembrane metalloprotease [Candidatus Dojkabacteria bacterium]